MAISDSYTIQPGIMNELFGNNYAVQHWGRTANLIGSSDFISLQEAVGEFERIYEKLKNNEEVLFNNKYSLPPTIKIVLVDLKTNEEMRSYDSLSGKYK